MSSVVLGFAGMTEADMVKGFRKETNQLLQTDTVILLLL